MNILILSLGGGGGNILRSLKALFRRDLATVQHGDPRYAERLRRAVVTRFLDTNAFSLADVPPDEHVVIGAQTTRRLGSRHDPDVARRALEESRAEVEALIKAYSVVILIGTGGKGTGAGTIVPIAQIARQHRKLVIPIFVRPSFEWHEVEKRRYDHALTIPAQLDTASIRFIEILNDRGYSSANPEPQTVVWERMNSPIARGLRGLLYVLSDLSQVDPSDLSVLFAGPGRLRVGFAEIDPAANGDPTDEQVQTAVRTCWDNPYSLFSKPVGTSLICIHGQWSNIVDGRIKGGLAALSAAEPANTTYNPLHAFVPAAPKPWGVTALFSEYTGHHAPIEIDWPEAKSVRQQSLVTATGPRPVRVHVEAEDPHVSPVAIAAAEVGPVREAAGHPHASIVVPAALETVAAPRPFSTLWEFALALNRDEPSALALAADGVNCDLPIEGSEIRRLIGTVWFRSAFRHLSPHWRDRLLDVLLDGTRVHNHALGDGRRTARLNQIPYDRLQQMANDIGVPEAVRADVQLLVAIATLWGSDALARVPFEPVEAEARSASGFGMLLQPFRNS